MTTEPLGGSSDHILTSGMVSRPLPDLPKGLPTTSGHPGESSDPIRTCQRVFRLNPDLKKRVFRPLPDLPEGLPTSSEAAKGSFDHFRTPRRVSRPF